MMPLKFQGNFSGSVIRSLGMIVLIALVGCAPANVKVGPKEDAAISGKVTYKGTPVTDARISFENPDIGAFGTEFKDGTFSIPKGSSGEFNVSITPVTPPMTMDATSGGKIPKVEIRTDIPKKYLDATKSGEKVIFKPGDNTYNLDMVD